MGVSNYYKKTMTSRLKLILFVILMTKILSDSFGQDTIIYQGIVNRKLLYETINLYPDKTFKRTSEYDLKWSEYGIYSIENNYLKLTYKFGGKKNSESGKDSVSKAEKTNKTEKFLIENIYLYRLTDSGKKIRRIKDQSIRTNWSWLIGHNYEIKKVTIANKR